MKKRRLSMKVLPGQPATSKGRLCIHLFVPDRSGPFTEHHVPQVDKVAADEGVHRIMIAPARGRLACDPKKTVALVERSGITHVTLRTGDPRAATCPKCLASTFYADMMSLLDQTTEQLTEES